MMNNCKGLIILHWRLCIWVEWGRSSCTCGRSLQANYHFSLTASSRGIKRKLNASHLFTTCIECLLLIQWCQKVDWQQRPYLIFWCEVMAEWSVQRGRHHYTKRRQMSVSRQMSPLREWERERERDADDESQLKESMCDVEETSVSSRWSKRSMWEVGWGNFFASRREDMRLKGGKSVRKKIAR